MFQHSVCGTVLTCLVVIGWSGSAFAAPCVIYEEDFRNQPVGSPITSAPANWTKGTGSVHNGELIITDATSLGGRAVDGSASTGWYSWAYKVIPNPVRPAVYKFTCRAWVPAGAHGCGVGFGKDDGKGGINCAAAWWYVRLGSDRGAWLFDARGLAAELAQDRKAYLPDFPGFVAPGGAEPVLVGGADQEVQLTIVVDTERHQVSGAVIDGSGTMHKSRLFTTDLGWTNAGIPRSEERVNSVVIWEHNVLSWLPQIDIAEIRVTSDEAPLDLTAEEIVMERPFTIIHNGHTTPDTKYLHDNVADIEKLGFDGFVLHVAHPRFESGIVFRGSPLVDMGWRAFQKIRFPEDAVRKAIEDLRSTRFDRLKHNVIGIVSLLPTDVNMDWFDDSWWDDVYSNARLLARVAKQGGCDGLLVDAEEYLGKIWTLKWLREDPIYEGKSYADLAPIVRERGGRFMEAINAEFPGIQIMFLHAWETVLNDISFGGELDKERLPDSVLSLWIPFLDGMLEASDDETVFVDGIEGGYSCETLTDFLRKARRLRRYGPELSDVPDVFRKKVRAGFGIYMNYGYTPPGGELQWSKYDPDDLDRNFWTPERLANAVASALVAADGPVWIWNESPCWLLDSPEAKLGGGIDMSLHAGWEMGKAVKYVPRAYWDALEQARQNAMAFVEAKRAELR